MALIAAAKPGRRRRIPRPWKMIARDLLHRLNAARFQHGLAAAFGASHAGTEVIVDVQLESVLDLARHIALVARPAEQRGAPKEERADFPH